MSHLVKYISFTVVNAVSEYIDYGSYANINLN